MLLGPYDALQRRLAFFSWMKRILITLSEFCVVPEHVADHFPSSWYLLQNNAQHRPNAAETMTGKKVHQHNTTKLTNLSC